MQTLKRILRISTLKGRLRLWVGLLIAAMCLLIVLFMSLPVKVIKEREIHAALKEAIEVQRHFIDNWKAERAADVDYLASLPGSRSLQLDEMSRQIELFRQSHAEFDSINFVNAAGKMYSANGGGFELDVSDRNYFTAARSENRYVTEVMTGRVKGQSIIAFSSPVRSYSDEFAGAIVATVKLTTLEGIVNSFQFGESGETFLLDHHGYRITNSPGGSEVTEKGRRYDTEIYKRAIAGELTSKAYNNVNGEPVFGAYAWSLDGRWLIVGETRTVDIYMPYWKLLVVMGLISGLVLLASYAAALLITQPVVDLLSALLQGTNRIREGKYGYRIDPATFRTAPIELKELSANFNMMSDKLQSTVQLLKESAVVDHLTEVYNRRFLMNEGAKIEEASARAGKPSCILIVDVDYFKQINDKYGHLRGDRVLKHAASLLVACVRKSDVVARYGGEEFIVLATNCDMSHGRELGERIRKWFLRSPYREENLEIGVTVSIGVSQTRPHRTYGTNTLEDMIERADKALYRAKNQGRNRVECDDASCEPEP
ncbi:sensor domain-containing diguanylate cyclase [Paenibacillus oceani]|uniref:Diguanylate cyclase n=1 Tax=Paenibacillus oceani TaxID=2772510 RepID=A0A927H1K3_9BACL|nr:diguanylate cyclase [Paenibacillus oceani]MBD2864287.1 diguanylate cyclase [Paenibacillus oceani]